MRSQILVRQMNPIVAGRVIPAAMHIHKVVSPGQRQMPIRLIYQPARALPFEVVNDVRERLPLQQIIRNLGQRARRCAPASDCATSSY